MLSISVSEAVLREIQQFYSKNRKSRIFTKNECSKENLIQDFFVKIIHFQSLSVKQITRKCNIFFLKVECFEDISNLKEKLNSSVEMLGFLPVKSVGNLKEF